MQVSSQELLLQMLVVVRIQLLLIYWGYNAIEFSENSVHKRLLKKVFSFIPLLMFSFAAMMHSEFLRAKFNYAV